MQCDLAESVILLMGLQPYQDNGRINHKNCKYSGPL